MTTRRKEEEQNGDGTAYNFLNTRTKKEKKGLPGCPPKPA